MVDRPSDPTLLMSSHNTMFPNSLHLAGHRPYGDSLGIGPRSIPPPSSLPPPPAHGGSSVSSASFTVPSTTMSSSSLPSSHPHLHPLGPPGSSPFGHPSAHHPLYHTHHVMHPGFHHLSRDVLDRDRGGSTGSTSSSTSSSPSLSSVPPLPPSSSSVLRSIGHHKGLTAGSGTSSSNPPSSSSSSSSSSSTSSASISNVTTGSIKGSSPYSTLGPLHHPHLTPHPLTRIPPHPMYPVGMGFPPLPFGPPYGAGSINGLPPASTSSPSPYPPVPSSSPSTQKSNFLSVDSLISKSQPNGVTNSTSSPPSTNSGSMHHLTNQQQQTSSHRGHDSKLLKGSSSLSSSSSSSNDQRKGGLYHHSTGLMLDSRGRPMAQTPTSSASSTSSAFHSVHHTAPPAAHSSSLTMSKSNSSSSSSLKEASHTSLPSSSSSSSSMSTSNSSHNNKKTISPDRTSQVTLMNGHHNPGPNTPHLMGLPSRSPYMYSALPPGHPASYGMPGLNHIPGHPGPLAHSSVNNNGHHGLNPALTAHLPPGSYPTHLIDLRSRPMDTSKASSSSKHSTSSSSLPQPQPPPSHLPHLSSHPLPNDLSVMSSSSSGPSLRPSTMDLPLNLNSKSNLHTQPLNQHSSNNSNHHLHPSSGLHHPHPHHPLPPAAAHLISNHHKQQQQHHFAHSVIVNNGTSSSSYHHHQHQHHNQPHHHHLNESSLNLTVNNNKRKHESSPSLPQSTCTPFTSGVMVHHPSPIKIEPGSDMSHGSTTPNSPFLMMQGPLSSSTNPSPSPAPCAPSPSPSPAGGSGGPKSWKKCFMQKYQNTNTIFTGLDPTLSSSSAGLSSSSSSSPDPLGSGFLTSSNPLMVGTNSALTHGLDSKGSTPSAPLPVLPPVIGIKAEKGDCDKVNGAATPTSSSSSSSSSSKGRGLNKKIKAEKTGTDSDTTASGSDTDRDISTKDKQSKGSSSSSASSSSTQKKKKVTPSTPSASAPSSAAATSSSSAPSSSTSSSSHPPPPSASAAAPSTSKTKKRPNSVGKSTKQEPSQTKNKNKKVKGDPAEEPDLKVKLDLPSISSSKRGNNKKKGAADSDVTDADETDEEKITPEMGSSKGKKGKGSAVTSSSSSGGKKETAPSASSSSTPASASAATKRGSVGKENTKSSKGGKGADANASISSKGDTSKGPKDKKEKESSSSGVSSTVSSIATTATNTTTTSSSVGTKKKTKCDRDSFDKSGLPFLQNKPCSEISPKTSGSMSKCRECRMTVSQKKQKDVGPSIFCRFFQFRKLMWDKELKAAGFSEPRDTRDEDFMLWLPPCKLESMELLKKIDAKFLIDFVGDHFCTLVTQEATALSIHMGDTRTIAWKSVVAGVREMCDVCETTLFNIHWVCAECGFVVCIDCYRSRMEDEGSICSAGDDHKEDHVGKESSGQLVSVTAGDKGKDRDKFDWLLCNSKHHHQQSKLVLTQIIAKTALWDVCHKLHQVKKLFGSSCGCPNEEALKFLLPNRDLTSRALKGPSTSSTPSSASSSIIAATTSSTAAGAVSFSEKEHPSNRKGSSSSSSTLPATNGANTTSSASSTPTVQPPKAPPPPPTTSPASASAASGTKSGSESSSASYASASSSSGLSVPKEAPGDLVVRGGSSSSSLSFLADVASKVAANGSSIKSGDVGYDGPNFAGLKQLLCPKVMAPSSSKVPPSISTVPINSSSTSPKKGRGGKKVTSPAILSTQLNGVVKMAGDTGSDSDQSLQYFIRKVNPIFTSKNLTPRVCVLEETQKSYPDIPHEWFCEGRLLVLKDTGIEKNLELFEQQWIRHQPVVVSKVHDWLERHLWAPNVFKNKYSDTKYDLINTETRDLVRDQPLKKYWEGFEMLKNRPREKDGRHVIYKLSDWPPGEEFSDALPEQFRDLMSCIPMPEYTTHEGVRNLAGRLPKSFGLIPDLGPKMYSAYGLATDEKGTTNLHLDMSDAVNVLVYVGTFKSKEDEREHQKNVMKALEESGVEKIQLKRSKGKEKVGALWHIYDARDADKIRDMLNSSALESGKKLRPHEDPIHDQTFYLDKKMRDKLKDRYGVEGYTIVQFYGDAVFIPAGAPHQVRNMSSCIKIAADFVSPENVAHCINLTEEFRQLSDKHENHEDKLQIKNIIYHTVKDALASFEDGKAAD